MSESNNNKNYCAENYVVNTIRNQTDEFKLEFIRNVSAQVEIPVAFKPSWKTSGTRKLFYPIKDGKEQKREWVYFEENKFYCTYCLCFAIKKNQLVEGIEYVAGSRMGDKLQKHDQAAFHKLAESTYLKFDCDIQQEACEAVSAKKNVLRSIVKIIIYIATHGMLILIIILGYEIEKELSLDTKHSILKI